MIKNQLYPFIEKYINEFLYGFTKEQLNVGVMNGIIALEGLNIRVDKVNEKLDNLEIPIWLKAGAIKKIRISCSLMNFIGEKPLDVNVEDIELIVCPSFKWIIKNFSTFIEENEYYIKEPYDPTDNNSHDIFSRKINIYDSSIIKKEKLYEIFSDPSTLAQILNKIFTKCLKFYYQKAYLINLKFKNIHLRFEDDELINIFTDIGLGLKISFLEVNLSAEGTKKKNNFKCENFNIYWEPKPSILIPSKKFRESFKDGQIDENYYEYLKSVMVDLKNSNFAQKLFLIDNFNFMGNMGIQFIESGNIDLFSKREKNYKFVIQVATSEMNLHVYPEILKISQRIVDFMKSFYVIDPVQDFKPMRKPYSKLSDLVKKMKNDSIFDHKRKRIVRDWIFYIIWFQRFKNAIYGKAFTNPLFSEFAKYFNICVAPNPDSKDPLGNNYPQINDSFYIKKNETSMIDPNVEKSGIKVNNPTSSKVISAEASKEDNMNPENINLTIFTEFLIKSANFHLHCKYINNKVHDYFLWKLSGIELRSLLLKEKFDASIEIKNFTINNKIIYEINKNLDTKIKDEILNNYNAHLNQNMNFDKMSIYTNNNFGESEKSIISSKIQITKQGAIAGNAIQLNNNLNDSFTSDVVFLSPAKKNNEENFLTFNQQNVVNPFNQKNIQHISNQQAKVENPKLNKRINMIHQTLDKIKEKQNIKNNMNKNEDSFITFFLNEENNPSGVIRENFSINSGLNSIQNIPNFNDVNVILNQNQNQNLSKMINEFNKSKLNQKNNTTMIKIQSKINNDNKKSLPVAIKNEATAAVTSITNISNIAQVEKKIPDPEKNLNENANLKIPINCLEIFPLNSGHNVTNESLKTVSSNNTNSCLSFRFAKSVVSKKPNLTLNLNVGACRVNMLDRNLESSLNILFDYKLEKCLEQKLKENDKSFMFRNKLFGVVDMKYKRQIYDMKNFMLHKVKNKFQAKDKENFNPDNLEFYNYIKKDMDKYDHNFLHNGNFELNYLFSQFQSQIYEFNLNFNEIYVVNLAFEDDTQKNIIKYGKIKIPKNFMKFSYTPKKFLSVKFFDFEWEFSESERLRKNLTEISKILEERLQSQFSNVNLIFRPVIKKILEEKKLLELAAKEKQPSKNLKGSNENSKGQQNSQLNKKSSIKQIQSEFQKILNNNINLNNPVTNVDKVKNPFEDISDNTFNQSHISFDDDPDLVKVTKNKKMSTQNIKEGQSFKISEKNVEKISEEDKSNKNEFIKKKSPSNAKTTFVNNNNNVRYEDPIANPLKFSDDSEFFYNKVTDRQEKFNESFPAKIFTDDHGESYQKILPKETSSIQDLKKNKPNDVSGVYIGKYNK